MPSRSRSASKRSRSSGARRAILEGRPYLLAVGRHFDDHFGLRRLGLVRAAGRPFRTHLDDHLADRRLLALVRRDLRPHLDDHYRFAAAWPCRARSRRSAGGPARSPARISGRISVITSGRISGRTSMIGRRSGAISVCTSGRISVITSGRISGSPPAAPRRSAAARVRSRDGSRAGSR